MRSVGFLILSLLMFSSAQGAETDQFTPPPTKLEDLGPTLNARVVVTLKKAMDETNSRIEFYEEVLRNNIPQIYREQAEKALAEAKTPLHLTSIFKHGITHGSKSFILITEVENWIGHLKELDGKPSRFRPRLRQSIHAVPIAISPFSYFVLAPTLNFYGNYMGGDKIGHFLAEGHSYFEVYTKAKEAGLSDEEATREAVAWGVNTESKVQGGKTTLVISNGDLAANYSGLKFYLHFFEPVTFNGETHQPLLVWKNERWHLNPKRFSSQEVSVMSSEKSAIQSDQVLKPFLSEYLNESFNPSLYGKSKRWYIRGAVQRRCQKWKDFYGELAEKSVVEARKERMKTWYGEDYGHTLPPDQEISVLTECF